jgi:hypothetical protein
VRALDRTFGKQHAIVGDDAARGAVDVGEAAHQRGAIARLELVEARAVHDPRDAPRARRRACAGLPGRHPSIRPGRRRALPAWPVPRPPVLVVEVGDDRGAPAPARGCRYGRNDPRRRTAACARRPAKLFGRHHLTGRRLHQRRAGEEDGALFLDDDGLVATWPAHRRRPPCKSP